MKRRTLLKELIAFLAAPLVFFGAKTPIPAGYTARTALYVGDIVTIKDGKIIPLTIKIGEINKYPAVGIWDGEKIVEFQGDIKWQKDIQKATKSTPVLTRIRKHQGQARRPLRMTVPR